MSVEPGAVPGVGPVALGRATSNRRCDRGDSPV